MRTSKRSYLREMINESFEIKVAILGYVSVGKTTVLNALFQDKFSEVSMRRTTAAINMFRISTRKQETTDTSTDAWSPDKGEPQEASSTLKETIDDNNILRTANVIKEKTFDIQLDEPLCEMRPDTTLVIVDVPGLNEAGSSDMYKGYVDQQWDTYDCVVVVMDAEKGVNTDEQVSLLEFVKMKQQTSKDVPVIVLCNKVDDPSNEEIAIMVNEVREKVEEVFNVDCRSETLEKLLNPPIRSGKSNSVTSTNSSAPSAYPPLSTKAPKPFSSGSGGNNKSGSNTPAPSVFSFAGGNAPAPAGGSGFSFGGGNAPPPASTDANAAAPSSGFSFVGASIPPAPATGSFSFGGNPAPAASRDNRSILVDFYTTHNPAKLNEVEKTLEKYKGREVEMFDKLARKYNVPSPLDVAATTPASPAPAAFAGSGFSFGGGNAPAPASTDTNATASSSGFSFVGASTAPAPATGGFSFGRNPAPAASRDTTAAEATTIFGRSATNKSDGDANSKTSTPSSWQHSRNQRRRRVLPKPQSAFWKAPTAIPAPLSSFSLVSGTTKSANRASSPVLFLPISAENAFIYRTVSKLSLEEYKQLDKVIIERLGQEEAGRMRWRAMTLEEKHSVVHAAVSDPSAYKERLESTNFDHFLKILNHCVGGVNTQTKILEKQLDIATSKVEGGKEGIAEQLRSIYHRSKVLGKPTNHLASNFWSVYKTVEDKAFACFRCDLSLGPLYCCMKELREYAKMENQVIYADGATEAVTTEHEKVLLAAKNLVKHQCMIIVENVLNWHIKASSFMTVGVLEVTRRCNTGRPLQISFRPPIGGHQSYSLQPGANEAMPKQHPFYWMLASDILPGSSLPRWSNSITGRSIYSKKNPDLPPISWTNLSPDDWMTIANSILLLLHDTHFAQNFGPEANELDLIKAQAFGMSLRTGGVDDVRKKYLAGMYVDGAFTPSDPTKYSLVRQVEMPESLADEQHWGHLAWMFCQFKQDLEG